jgi:hypothetical protein
MTCFTAGLLSQAGIILIGLILIFDWCADLIAQINTVVVVHTTTLLTNEIARFYCLCSWKVGRNNSTS